MTTQLDDITLSDLKLLRLLLRTESLTRTSLTLGWSVPKASHRLSGLRDALGDELFVRSGNSLVPTSWMKELAPRIERASEALAALDCHEEFHLEAISRNITIELVDNAAVMLFAPAFESIRRKAPNFRLSLRASVGMTLENLWDGHTEIAFGADIDRELPGDIRSLQLFESRHVLVMRRGHPLLGRLLSRCGAGGELVAGPADLAPWPAVSISLPRWRAVASNVAIGWRQEIPSPICLETPFFLAVPAFLTDSDAYAALPAELARDFCNRHDLAYVEAEEGVLRPWLPRIMWHVRSSSDFALQWMRSEICRYWSGHEPPPRATAPGRNGRS